MTFDEWANTQPVFVLKPLTTHDWLRMAWEASKAEERERCAKIAEQSYFGVTPYTRIGEIAEQIRKGE